MKSQIFYRSANQMPASIPTRHKRNRMSVDLAAGLAKFAFSQKKHLRRCSDGIPHNQSSTTIKSRDINRIPENVTTPKHQQRHRSKVLRSGSKGRSSEGIQIASKMHSATCKNSVKASVQQSCTITKNNSPSRMSPAETARKQPRNSVSDYKFFYQIGFGAFGKVWKISDRQGGREYALKEISKIKVVEKCNISAIMNERLILSRLDHPFLINIVRSFQDESNLYLIMNYLRGADLRYHICYKERFSEKQIKFIAACVLQALQYIHQQGVIHRDIKPENIVFQEGGYARLTDFGIAQTVKDSGPLKGEASGTPVYMAPEILFKGRYSFQSDFYSLGIIIFQLAMGRRPYNGKTRNDVREELLGREVCLGEFDAPQDSSFQLISLINALLKKNPSQRLGRGGAEQIKSHPFFRGVSWAKLNRKQVKPPFSPHIVCQTQSYLSEIALFNEMNAQSQENTSQLLSEINGKFKDYDYEREGNRRQKGGLKKMKRGSQIKFV